MDIYEFRANVQAPGDADPVRVESMLKETGEPFQDKLSEWLSSHGLDCEVLENYNHGCISVLQFAEGTVVPDDCDFAEVEEITFEFWLSKMQQVAEEAANTAEVLTRITRILLKMSNVLHMNTELLRKAHNRE